LFLAEGCQVADWARRICATPPNVGLDACRDMREGEPALNRSMPENRFNVTAGAYHMKNQHVRVASLPLQGRAWIAA